MPLNKLANDLLENKILWIVLISWSVAQILKFVTELVRYRQINIARMISSGGMPSSHTSLVTSLATAVGLKAGFDSVAFAVCVVLSMVVMYDAAGVRRAAGKQAEVLNQIVSGENAGWFGINLDKELKELLGHSPLEVAAGAALGIAIALIFLIVSPYV